MPHGWYLYSSSTIAADWEGDSGNRWTVPVGGRIGKVFSIDKGSDYAPVYLDADKKAFDGSRTYKLHLPPNVPVKEK